MKRRSAQRGLTLLEVLVGLALTAMLLASVNALLLSGTAAAAVSADQLDLQQQAQFAIHRIAQRIALTAPQIAPKAESASSDSLLSPALYDLRPGSAPNTLALTETIGPNSHVLAEPVSAFSVSAPGVVAGLPVVAVSLTLARGNSSASASLTARMGMAQ